MVVMVVTIHSDYKMLHTWSYSVCGPRKTCLFD